MRYLDGWRGIALAIGAVIGAPLFTGISLAQVPSGWSVPEHKRGWPQIIFGTSVAEEEENFRRGTQYETGRSPAWALGEHRKLEAMLDGLQPGVEGQVDAFVISIGLDSDPVFGREAREAARVLARRYNAEGRTAVLAGSTGAAPSDLPTGSPYALGIALARVAELMAPEDVLVLYTTSHGAPFGIAYHDGDEGYGIISPVQLKQMLDNVAIEKRMLLISACYSGVFVPVLGDENTVVMTAASATQPSFGCMADNDWTFFGDALVNRSLREPQSFKNAAEDAQELIVKWEEGEGVEYSNPQLSIGSSASSWLKPLEKRMPKTATAPVGRPATDAFLPVAANRSYDSANTR